MRSWNRGLRLLRELVESSRNLSVSSGPRCIAFSLARSGSLESVLNRSPHDQRPDAAIFAEPHSEGRLSFLSWREQATRRGSKMPSGLPILQHARCSKRLEAREQKLPPAPGMRRPTSIAAKEGSSRRRRRYGRLLRSRGVVASAVLRRAFRRTAPAQNILSTSCGSYCYLPMRLAACVSTARQFHPRYRPLFAIGLATGPY